VQCFSIAVLRSTPEVILTGRFERPVNFYRKKTMRKDSVFFVLILLSLHPASAQQPTGSLSGFVYDAANGEGLIGASVFLPGTTLGSATNVNGYYVIPRVPVGQYVLQVRYLGYKSFSKELIITADAPKTIDIRLESEQITLNTIVTTATKERPSEQMYEKAISNIELLPRQINAIPQIAEADLLRSLQTLPGIVPLSDFSSDLYVRGGNSDQNLYLLDGADVYNPEHAFGIFSTFNTDAIKHVELSKGGFGAEYDGRLSSVLNITHLDGNREEFEGTGSLSLLSAKTTLQMPIGKIGSLSGSIRRTYFDQTIGKALDDIPQYYFYDGNVKAFFDINARNKLALSGYGGRDILNLTFNNKTADKSGLKYNWGNRTGSARWTHVFSPALFVNFWLTGSEFTSTFHLQDGNITEKNDISDLTVKGNLEYHLSQRWIMRFGFEQKNWDVVFRQTGPGFEVAIKNRPRLYSGYTVAIWRPTPLWEIEGGWRYNLLRSDTIYRNLSPRFSAKYRLTDKNSVKAAFGIYHQYLQRIPRFIVADIWTIADRNYRESTARHAILGYQQEIAGNYRLEIETFYKTYQNILVFNDNFLTELQTSRFNAQNNPVYNETKSLFNRGDGSTLGFEVMLKKDVGIVTGWLGYSFSRTQYEFEAVNQGRSFYPRHDRSHTVNLASTMGLGNAWRALWGRETNGARGKWSLGVNFVYYTGQPYTEPGSGYLVGADPDARERLVQLAPTKINNIRFPYYSRLDLSLTWLKQYKGWSMSPYAQVFNIGNRKNVWFANYDYTGGVPDLNEQYMFPFLPTLGVNFKF